MIPSPTPRPRGARPVRLIAALTLLLTAGLVASCSAGSDDSAGDAGGDTASPSGDERIVVIGEEYLLADLLALGIKPVASTATVAEAGFAGLDDHDTSEIEALPATERNLERLAAFAPDTIIVLEFFAREIGDGALDGMADEVVVIPDGIGPVELVTTYGELFGREERAAELVAEYEAAGERAVEALSGRAVTVAAIYAGPSVAAFVEGPWAVPQTLLDAGATLVPGPSEASPDRNGRAYLSMERLDLLDAPQMVLLTTPLVEGERQAIETVTSSPLWTSLPAVEDDEVHELDRLGYPGIEGRIRLIDDLVAALG